MVYASSSFGTLAPVVRGTFDGVEPIALPVGTDSLSPEVNQQQELWVLRLRTSHLLE
jgi:hypothetical protein